jgi:hypothetical protein
VVFTGAVANPGLVHFVIAEGSRAVLAILVAVVTAEPSSNRWAVTGTTRPWAPACAAAAAEDTTRTVVTTLLTGADGCTEGPRQVATDLQTQNTQSRILDGSHLWLLHNTSAW